MSLLKADEKELEELEKTKWKRVGKTLLKDWRLYVLLLPMLIFLVMFKYLPIYGLLQGFKTYNSVESVLDQDWRGIAYLLSIFKGGSEDTIQFWVAFRNTFVNSMYGLFFGFPIPIILALFFTEIKNGAVRSVVQVCTYLPKFMSTIVTATIIIVWCRPYTQSGTTIYAPGLLQNWCENLHLLKIDSTTGHAATGALSSARLFRPIYQITGIWEGSGYGSIVYFAAALGVSPANYEAAKIDGASKMQQIRYVTLPGMTSTLAIMLILRIGHILNVGYEKVLLLYKTDTYETADVISTWVYRKVSTPSDQPLGIVAGLLESIIAMVLVIGANAISKRVSNTSLF
ncbi:MAG: ABC transporter permease subunit [Acholeplasmatales bacterium]|nr:ABC transporter permease subunit [Acholeplasmatales bacterium]